MSGEHQPREFLLDVASADRLALPGARFAPASGSLDTCVVWFPGFGMSYDYPPTLAVGRLLAAGGTGFLSAAVRGHHGAVTAWQRRDGGWGTKRVGSWYEILDETPADIDAWIAAAREFGYRRVILAGHSFGAIKALYYLATGGGPVDGLVLASPSLGITTLTTPTVELARALVAEGHGTQLLPEGSWPRGFGTRTVSAQTMESWARGAELVYADPAPWKSALTAPVLAYYGDDADVGAEPELAMFTAGMDNAASVTTLMLPGISHNFQEGAETIAAAIGAWLATAVDGPATSNRKARDE